MRLRDIRGPGWRVGVLLVVWLLALVVARADCPTNQAALVDLSNWTVVQYGPFGQQPPANWILSQSNTEAIQTINADASILLSPFTLQSDQMQGRWRVDTTIDDDFIGFVFGYQDMTHFYLFDWKELFQGNYGVTALPGMSVKVVSANSALTGADLYATTPANTNRVRTIYHNSIAYSDLTDYDFKLEFQPGQFTITVSQGATILTNFTLNDTTYIDGRFGFYNFSQDSVRYSGFTRQVLTPRPLIVAPPASVIEGHTGTTNLVFSVSLSSSNCDVTTVDYGFIPGTATLGVDYLAVPGGRLTFPPGVTNLLLTVPVVGDREIEPNETLFLILSNVVNGTLGVTQITGTIINDDTNAPPTVRLVEPGATPCLLLPADLRLVADPMDSDGSIARVQFFRNGTTLLGEVFAPPYELIWSNVPAGTHVLTAVAWDDRNARGTSAPVSITASFPSALSIDDRTVVEGNGGVIAVFSVTLTPASCRPVSVDVRSFDVTALAGSDYLAVITNLTFAPGQTLRTVSVPIVGDTIEEPDETFTLCLTNVVGATVARPCGLGTIINDDTNQPPSVVLVSPDPNACLRLPADLLIAAQATDPDGTIMLVRFYDWGTNLLGEVTKPPFQMIWSNVPPGAHLLSALAFDDFGASAVSASVSLQASYPSALAIDDQTVLESAGAAVFTVRLDPPSCRPVRVQVLTQNGTATAGLDYTAVVVNLLFQPGETALPVSVPILSDQEIEPDETFRICLIEPNGATLARACGLGTILNDDSNRPPVIVITAPADGAVFSIPPGQVSIQAEAYDADGVVTQVQFYANGVLLGELSNGPWLLPWTNQFTGPYTLLAIATDNSGAHGTSAPVNITFRTCDLNLAVAPLPNQTRCLCDEVTFSAIISSGEAVTIAWKANGLLLPGETNSTLRLYNLHPPDAGIYTVEVTSPCATVARSATLVLKGAGNENPVSFTNAGRIVIFDNNVASPYPAPILVECLPGPIKHVSVTLDGLSHNYPDDVDILLAGPAQPNGTTPSVRLLSDAGGGDNVTNIVLTFTDTATNRLPNSTVLLAGTYAPTDYETPLDNFPLPAPAPVTTTNFAPFLGASGNGTWSLYVRDDLGGDGGTISGWRLTIEWQDTLPYLSAPQYLADGSFQATLTGLPRMTHVVEVSTDLVHWEPMRTNTFAAPLVLTLPPNGPGAAPHRFFRAVRCP